MNILSPKESSALLSKQGVNFFTIEESDWEHFADIPSMPVSDLCLYSVGLKPQCNDPRWHVLGAKAILATLCNFASTAALDPLTPYLDFYLPKYRGIRLLLKSMIQEREKKIQKGIEEFGEKKFFDTLKVKYGLTASLEKPDGVCFMIQYFGIKRESVPVNIRMNRGGGFLINDELWKGQSFHSLKKIKKTFLDQTSGGLTFAPYRSDEDICREIEFLLQSQTGNRNTKAANFLFQNINSRDNNEHVKMYYARLVGLIEEFARRDDIVRKNVKPLGDIELVAETLENPIIKCKDFVAFAIGKKWKLPEEMLALLSDETKTEAKQKRRALNFHGHTTKKLQALIDAYEHYDQSSNKDVSKWIRKKYPFIKNGKLTEFMASLIRKENDFKMRVLEAMAEEMYRGLKSVDDVPTTEEIIDWLTDFHPEVSPDNGKLMAELLRPDGLPKGRRIKSMDA
jgi:hypothetical protein